MPNYGSSTTFLADEITQKVVSVSTSAVELFTGGVRNASRQMIRVYNDGSQICYLGPSGVTASGSAKGEALQKQQSITYPIGDVGLFAITASGSTSLVITEVA